MNLERRVRLNANLFALVNLKRVATLWEIPISIEHRSEDGGQKLESVFGLHDNHVKHAVTRLIRMRERDIELNLREINDEHAQAFGFVAFAIDGYRDFRSLRNNIATRGQEIRDSTEELLVRSRAFHNRRIVARTRHDHEAVLFAFGFDFGDIEVKRLATSSELRQRVRLVRLSQVEGKQIRRASRVGQKRHTSIHKRIRDRSHRSIAARSNDHIEIARIVKQAVD